MSEHKLKVFTHERGLSITCDKCSFLSTLTAGALVDYLEVVQRDHNNRVHALYFDGSSTLKCSALNCDYKIRMTGTFTVAKMYELEHQHEHDKQHSG